MLPAQQRLGRRDLAAVGIDLGLEVQLELVLHDRLAQVAHHVEVVLGVGVHVRRVEAQARAAGPLGGVHGHVGTGNEFALAAAVRVHRNAHRARDAHLAFVDAVGPAECIDQALAHLRHHLLRAGVGHQHQELVTAHTGGHVGPARDRLEAAAHLFEHPIATVVAIGVVHGLEAVEIDEEHRQLAALVLHLLGGRRQPALEVKACRQAGEVVHRGRPHRPDQRLGRTVDRLAQQKEHHPRQQRERGRHRQLGPPGGRLDSAQTRCRGRGHTHDAGRRQGRPESRPGRGAGTAGLRMKDHHRHAQHQGSGTGADLSFGMRQPQQSWRRQHRHAVGHGQGRGAAGECRGEMPGPAGDSRGRGQQREQQRRQPREQRLRTPRRGQGALGRHQVHRPPQAAGGQHHRHAGQGCTDGRRPGRRQRRDLGSEPQQRAGKHTGSRQADQFVGDHGSSWVRTRAPERQPRLGRS